MKTLQELEALPDDELRVMLAEITGKMCDNCGCSSCDCEIVGIGSGSPNYPQSQDACHAVVITLTGDDRSLYCDHLSCLRASYHDKVLPIGELRWEFEWHSHIAPARQRTIALILTLQKP